MRAANKQVAEIVAAEAKRHVPLLSGDLKKSISAVASEGAAYVKAGTEKRVPYALPIEFGWKARNITAQPYMYPAIEAKQMEVIDAYAKAINVLNRAFPEPRS